MKKILGKIFAVALFTTTLFAGVKAYVNQSAIYSGDSISFTISIDGQNPKFPNITQIGAYSVLGVSSSQSVNIINGDYKSVVSKTYEFSPTKSMTIPSFKVESDGKTYNTTPIEIKVLKPSASKPTDEVSISMVANKNKVYVGEPIKLAVKVKYKLNANIDKISLTEPKMDNFWVKKSDKPVQSMNGDTVIQTYNYLIFPQNSGNFTIDPIIAKIGKVSRTNTGGSLGGNFFNDPFFNAFNSQIRWKKIFSNDLNVSVKPLPDNLEVYGSFHINASVDKSETFANKPVNLTIKIDGTGNIDDIKKFSVNMPNVVEYSDNPTVRSGLNAGHYGGVFSQKVALIADKDFVIPSLKFTYFDKNLKKVVTKETKPISIKVKGGVKVEAAPKIDTLDSKTNNTKAPSVSIKNNVSNNTEVPYLKYIFLLLGFVLGCIVTFLFVGKNRKTKKKQELPIIKQIKKAKNNKELFDVLLSSQKDDPFIQNIVEKLEENIYRKGQHKFSKKELIEHFLEIEL
ncbi:MAG: BatD family protein [Sulfurospirillaceae bacterium]|nr:BatD family protein [Sulfurospirillaceae bacterium]